MAAGCEGGINKFRSLIRNLFSLSEPFVGFDRNWDNLEKKYGKVLLKSIKNYWSSENQNKLKIQSEAINATYSWDVRSAEWKDFFNEIRDLKN